VPYSSGRIEIEHFLLRPDPGDGPNLPTFSRPALWKLVPHHVAQEQYPRRCSFSQIDTPLVHLVVRQASRFRFMTLYKFFPFFAAWPRKEARVYFSRGPLICLPVSPKLLSLTRMVSPTQSIFVLRKLLRYLCIPGVSADPSCRRSSYNPSRCRSRLNFPLHATAFFRTSSD